MNAGRIEIKKSVAGILVVVLLSLASTILAVPAGATMASGQTASTSATDGNLAEGVSPGVSDSITRLYLAVFDREPDASGHAFWVSQYVNGVALPRIAETFISSAEWQRHIGTLTNAEFIGLLYNNVLDRPPDAVGEKYWLDEAARGLTRTDMLLWFSEGDEFVRLTGTAAPEAPPFPTIPADSGEGRRIVYSNSDQRVWIIESDGRIRDSYLVSGREGVPNPGTHQVFSKSETAYAGHDGITMKHMVRFAWGRRLAIGFHSIPRYGNGTPMQAEAELGTYQSAGCVRQADHQAEALYHWAQIGDTVVVLP